MKNPYYSLSDLYNDDVLRAFYEMLLDETLEELHIPHSDVFYVRAAYEYRTGNPCPFTLEELERAMIAEGWDKGHESVPREMLHGWEKKQERPEAR